MIGIGFGKRVSLTLAVLAGAGSASQAADRYWVGSSTYWDLTSGWSASDHGAGGASVPVNGDNVIIDPVGTTVFVYRDSVTPNYTSPGLNTLTLNGTGGAVAIVEQLNNNAMYVSGTLTVGSTGVGHYQLQGGTASFNNLVVGAQAGSTGTFSMTGATTVLNANTAYFGAVPGSGATINATYNQSGGTATFATFSLSASSNAIATANLGSGTFNAYNFYTGSDGGTGTFNHNGGTVNGTYGNVGHNAGGNGTYNLSNGTSTFLGLYVGDSNGHGTFNINNGGVLGTSSINLGGGSGNGLLAVNAGGTANIGSFNINNNGVINVASGGTVNFGQVTTSAITAGGSFVSNGFVSFYLSTINITGGGSMDLEAGTSYSGGATISLSNGGQFISTKSDFAGAVDLQPGGTFTIPGRHTSFRPILLNGGQFNAGFIQDLSSSPTTVFNAGTFNLTGGTTLLIGNAGASGGNVLGNLSLNNARTLINNGTVSILANGSLSLDGGTLAAGTITSSGNFAFNSGLLRLTASNLVIGNGGLLGATATLDASKRIDIAGANQLVVDSGGLLYETGANLAATGGYLNNGEFLLASPTANITGGSFNNAGLLDGSGRINSVLANSSAGTVRVARDDRLTFNSSGNTNAGTIQLLGGVVEFKNDLTNNKTIAGRGSLYVNGGLTNNGTMLLASGPAEVLGNVSNSAAAKVLVTGGADATFYNNVISAAGASFKVDSGSVLSVLGNVSGGSFGGAGTIVFQSAASPSVINGSGATIVDVGGSVKTSVVTENSLTLHGSLVLAGSAATVSKVQSLSIDGGQTLDLTNNKLVIDYSDTSPLATVRGELAAGQILATTAAKNQRIGYAEASEVHASTFGGTSVDATSLLLMSTLAGDCNLDGKVDIVDLGLLAGSWQKTSSDWFNGDYNYDGRVDIVDLGMLASNWQSAVPLATAMAELNFNTSAVPEPGMLGVVAIGGCMLRRRRVS